MDTVIADPPAVTVPVQIDPYVSLVAVPSTCLVQVIPPPVAVGVPALRLFESSDSACRTRTSPVAGVKLGVVVVPDEDVDVTK
jgi:hypothetical protein